MCFVFYFKRNIYVFCYQTALSTQTAAWQVCVYTMKRSERSTSSIGSGNFPSWSRYVLRTVDERLLVFMFNILAGRTPKIITKGTDFFVINLKVRYHCRGRIAILMSRDCMESLQSVYTRGSVTHAHTLTRSRT